MTVMLSRPPPASAWRTSSAQASFEVFIAARVAAISSSSTRSVRPSLQSSTRSPSSSRSRSTSTSTFSVEPPIALVRMCATPGAGDVAGRELPLVHQQLGKGVVLGEAMQVAGAEQVRARVADVDDEEVAAVAAGGGQRRSHAAQVVVFAPALDEHRADLLHQTARAALDLGHSVFVHLEDPVGQVEDEADERADGEPARDLAGGVAAHAVGDDHHVIDFIRALGHVARRQAAEHRLEGARESGDEELVFVVGAGCGRDARARSHRCGRATSRRGRAAPGVATDRSRDPGKVSVMTQLLDDGQPG